MAVICSCTKRHKNPAHTAYTITSNNTCICSETSFLWCHTCMELNFLLPQILRTLLPSSQIICWHRTYFSLTLILEWGIIVMQHWLFPPILCMSHQSNPQSHTYWLLQRIFFPHWHELSTCICNNITTQTWEHIIFTCSNYHHHPYNTSDWYLFLQFLEHNPSAFAFDNRPPTYPPSTITAQ